MPCGLRRSPPPRYEYEALGHDTNDIRLLYPQRGTKLHNCWDRSLRFDAKTVQLAKDDAVFPYYAISYAWYQSGRRSRIYVNDQALEVPCGAEEALRGVIRGLRAAKLRKLPLWIDAICINQHDRTGEKSHQVRIMGDIYARAECVLIWLGPDEGSARKSIQMCHKLSEECSQWTNNGLDLGTNQSLPPTERQDLPYMKLPPPPARQLESFYSLLRYRWFSRTWVIQEVVLARQAIVLCGNRHISWDTFALAIQWARHRTPLWAVDCVSSQDFDSLVKVNKIACLRLGREDMTMEALLTLARKYQSTDPRDEVYGLLGMVETCPDTKPIIPDYRKSLKEVYAQATWFAIRQELSLELLCHITPHLDNEDDRNSDPWPSWIPRYDRIYIASTAAASSPGSNAHNDYQALISLDPHLPFTLHAHGVSLGHIETLRPSPAEIIETNMFECHDAVYRHFSYLWDPAFPESRHFAWSTDSIKTIAAALVCGKYSRDPDKPYQDAGSDSATMTDFAAFMFEIKKCCSIPDFPLLQTLLEAFQPEEGDAFLYTKTVKYFAQRFLHLELSTARFGIGYRACRKGDEVCVLFGARQPFVMRKVGGHYRLLGPVYVAGVMKGEHVQQLEDQGMLEAEDRVYEIR